MPIAPRGSASGLTATRAVALAAVAVVLALAGCAGDGRPTKVPGHLSVVAAENVWGSVAAELAGDRADVVSLISNRNVDPHEYEPTVADARAIADADLLIVNGAGYDSWVAQLAAASPDESRALVDAAALAGIRPGGNPHVWYSPAAVHATASRIALELAKLDPKGAGYYAARLRRYEDVRLGRYDALVAEGRNRYAGVAVGASESIFLPLADALGLKVVTPAAFVTAVSEGTDPSAAAKSSALQQMRSGEVAVFVYNEQNATPDVGAIVAAARAAGVPVVRVSETIPAGQSFSSWQTTQLESLLTALKEATGR